MCYTLRSKIIRINAYIFQLQTYNGVDCRCGCVKNVRTSPCFQIFVECSFGGFFLGSVCLLFHRMNYDHAIGYENRILYFAPFFGLLVARNDAFVCLFVDQRPRKHGIIPVWQPSKASRILYARCCSGQDADGTWHLSWMSKGKHIGCIHSNGTHVTIGCCKAAFGIGGVTVIIVPTGST